jgi:hypothetical protein
MKLSNYRKNAIKGCTHIAGGLYIKIMKLSTIDGAERCSAIVINPYRCRLNEIKALNAKNYKDFGELIFNSVDQYFISFELMYGKSDQNLEEKLSTFILGFTETINKIVDRIKKGDSFTDQDEEDLDAFREHCDLGEYRFFHIDWSFHQDGCRSYNFSISGEAKITWTCAIFEIERQLIRRFGTENDVDNFNYLIVKAMEKNKKSGQSDSSESITALSRLLCLKFADHDIYISQYRKYLKSSIDTLLSCECKDYPDAIYVYNEYTEGTVGIVECSNYEGKTMYDKKDITKNINDLSRMCHKLGLNSKDINNKIAALRLKYTLD